MKYCDQSEYNVFNNTLKESDQIFITCDNILYFKEIGFIDHVLKNEEKYKDKLNLDIFENYCRPAIIRILLERKTKDLINWLVKDNISNSEKNDLHKEYENFFSQKRDNYTGEITDIGKGFLKYLATNNVKKIVVAVNYKYLDSILAINSLFKEYFRDKVSVINNTEENIIKYISDRNYTVIFSDELDILSKHFDKLTGKTICLAYAGYNFSKKNKEFKVDNLDLLISNNEFEYNSIKYEFSLGFLEPFNMTEEMFSLG